MNNETHSVLVWIEAMRYDSECLEIAHENIEEYETPIAQREGAGQCIRALVEEMTVKNLTVDFRTPTATRRLILQLHETVLGSVDWDGIGLRYWERARSEVINNTGLHSTDPEERKKHNL